MELVLEFNFTQTWLHHVYLAKAHPVHHPCNFYSTNLQQPIKKELRVCILYCSLLAQGHFLSKGASKENILVAIQRIVTGIQWRHRYGNTTLASSWYTTAKVQKQTHIEMVTFWVIYDLHEVHNVGMVQLLHNWHLDFDVLFSWPKGTLYTAYPQLMISTSIS